MVGLYIRISQNLNWEVKKVSIFYALLGRVLSLEDDENARINTQEVFKKVIESSTIDRKMIIEKLAEAPMGVISNSEKKKVIQYMYAVYHVT